MFVFAAKHRNVKCFHTYILKYWTNINNSPLDMSTKPVHEHLICGNCSNVWLKQWCLAELCNGVKHTIKPTLRPMRAALT